MENKYKLAIFDLDGTLLDTLEDLMLSVNEILKRNNFPIRSLEEIRKFVGNGTLKLMERSLPSDLTKEEIAKYHEEFKKYYDMHCNDTTKPYDDILEVLNTLKDRGVVLAMLSNKPDFAVKKLNDIYFGDIFTIARGALPDVPTKPAPDSVNKIMEDLSISKADTVYIGDSDVDINTSKNAKIAEIAVTWGFRDKDFLVKNGANTFAYKCSDLLNLI